ncbi:hypothetical protein FDC02_01905 [Clostridium botulinum]|nr:hypothetical protein [Clostridium botulinum]
MIKTPEGYMNTKETYEALGMGNLSLTAKRTNLKDLNIHKKKISDGRSVRCFYLINDVNKVINNARKFYKEYCSYDEIDLPQNLIRTKLKTYPMPKGYTCIFSKQRFSNTEYKTYKVIYKKKEVQELRKKYLATVENGEDEELNLNEIEYINKFQAAKLLGYSYNVFMRILKELDIGLISFRQRKVIKIEDFKLIAKDKENYDKNFISYKLVSEKYLNGGESKKIKDDLKVYKAPIWAKDKINITSISKFGGVFKIEDVEEYFKYKINNNLTGDSAFKTFNVRLNDVPLWDGFESDTEYTSKMWFEYVENAFSNTNIKGATLVNLINNFVRSTLDIKDVLARFGKVRYSL